MAKQRWQIFIGIYIATATHTTVFFVCLLVGWTTGDDDDGGNSVCVVGQKRVVLFCVFVCLVVDHIVVGGEE